MIGPSRTNATRRSAKHVHRSLLTLCIVLWFVVSFHGVILRRQELWPHGPWLIGLGIVPPALPILAVVWGRWGFAAASLFVTALAAGGWQVAARHPEDSFCLFSARVGLVVYWLTLSFLIAFGT